MEITRSNFYMAAAAFRHRRRRVRGVYSSPLDYDYEQKNRIQVTETKSFDEYYYDVSNYYQTQDDKTETLTSETLAKPTTYVTPENQQTKKSTTRQVISKTKQKQKQKAQTPVITAQGQEGRTRTVQYKDKDGKIYYKRGGTPAWRNNNPGNLSFSSLESAKRHGAIDVVLDRNKNGKIVHRWGVFSTPEAGEKAMRNLLKERRFSWKEKKDFLSKAKTGKC